MKKKPKQPFKSEPYQYEIGYSQGSIVGGCLFGLFLLLGSVAGVFWLESWAPILYSLFGIFMLWQAVKRFRSQGPQLKIGAQGIWTVKIGSLPWHRVKVHIAQTSGYRSVSTRLVIESRQNPGVQLDSFNIHELDSDSRTLYAIVKEFSRHM